MQTTELIVTIVVGVCCLALGIFLGSMPLKRKELTEWHSKYQQLGGILACGMVVILMLLGYDIGSWVCIAAVVVGVGVSRIPVLHTWLLAQFPELRPAERNSPLTRPRKK